LVIQGPFTASPEIDEPENDEEDDKPADWLTEPKTRMSADFP
jgi:hypothetical protein